MNNIIYYLRFKNRERHICILAEYLFKLLYANFVVAN